MSIIHVIILSFELVFKVYCKTIAYFRLIWCILICFAVDYNVLFADYGVKLKFVLTYRKFCLCFYFSKYVLA